MAYYNWLVVHPLYTANKQGEQGELVTAQMTCMKYWPRRIIMARVVSHPKASSPKFDLLPICMKPLFFQGNPSYPPK